jgi:hypothetical protein
MVSRSPGGLAVQRLASSVLALCLTLAGIAPAAASGEFSSGRWTGQAFVEGGKFTHCAMLAPYVSRWQLLFSVDRNGDIGLGFQSQNVQMYPWQTAQIYMQIDNEPVITPVFKPAGMTLVVAKFRADSDWIKRLRKGKKLKVNVGKRVPNFDLAGLDEAFTALFACAQKNRTA